MSMVLFCICFSDRLATRVRIVSPCGVGITMLPLRLCRPCHDPAHRPDSTYGRLHSGSNNGYTPFVCVFVEAWVRFYFVLCPGAREGRMVVFGALLQRNLPIGRPLRPPFQPFSSPSGLCEPAASSLIVSFPAVCSVFVAVASLLVAGSSNGPLRRAGKLSGGGQCAGIG